MKLKTLTAATLVALGVSGAAFAKNDQSDNRFVNVIVRLDTSTVNFEKGNGKANKAVASKVAKSMGLSPKHVYGNATFGFAASIPEGKLNMLEHNPHIASWQFDKAVQAPPWAGGGGGGSNGQTMPWGIARTGADVVTNEGAGVHVYILDTGLDSDHPDLAANIGNGFAAENCKGKSCNQAWDDDHGHGTHVGGTVGAIDNDIDVVGMASQVTLHAGKICTSRGSCPNSSTIAALDWVTSEISARGQAAVVNMSIGGSGSVTGSCTDVGYIGTDAYHEALCSAKNAGAVIVVAAGNSSANAANYTPAGYDDTVVTVSSAKEGDDWNSFSNYGTASASWTPHNAAPIAIAAPGGNILSLAHGGGTTTMSGTSMASPHAAGAAALYLAAYPQANNASAFHNFRAWMIQNEENTSNWSNTSGYPHAEGFLDVRGL